MGNQFVPVVFVLGQHHVRDQLEGAHAEAEDVGGPGGWSAKHLGGQVVAVALVIVHVFEVFLLQNTKNKV